MGRAPCCSKVGLHKGPWTPREDALLTKYIQAHGEGQWKSLPKKAGLLRCGKSCRLRWMNYLRPDIKRGNITPEEDDLIIRMHSLLGNRWSLIAGRLPGRTDNEIKNYWNTHLSKKLRNHDPNSDNNLADLEQESNKKKNNGDRKKKNKKKKQKQDKNRGENNAEEEEEKTQIYLPKPIRVKALSLPRTDSGSFTLESNSSACASTSQEKEESLGPKEAINDMVCDVGENDDFGIFGDHHELVNDGLHIEYQSYIPTEHGTLEKLYEEYLQLLNMDDCHFQLDSFAQSLLEE